MNFCKHTTVTVTINTTRPMHIEDLMLEFWFLFDGGWQESDTRFHLTAKKAAIVDALESGLRETHADWLTEIDEMVSQIGPY